MIGPSLTADNSQPLSSFSSLDSISKSLHTLSNKLLPILVFSELALRRCTDEHIRKQLEKIHTCAEEARGLLSDMRSHGKIGSNSSDNDSSEESVVPM